MQLTPHMLQKNHSATGRISDGIITAVKAKLQIILTDICYYIAKINTLNFQLFYLEPLKGPTQVAWK